MRQTARELPRRPLLPFAGEPVSLQSCLLLVLMRVARLAQNAGRYIRPENRLSRRALAYHAAGMRQRARTGGDVVLYRCLLAVLTAYPSKVLP